MTDEHEMKLPNGSTIGGAPAEGVGRGNGWVFGAWTIYPPVTKVPEDGYVITDHMPFPKADSVYLRMHKGIQ